MNNDAAGNRGMAIMFIGLILMVVGGIAYWSLKTYFSEGNFRTAEDIDMGKAAIGILGVLGGIIGLPMFIGGLIQFFLSNKVVPEQPSKSALTDELSKLQSLYEQGVLSDDEFNTAKARLLGFTNQQR